jgi:hypothetical protein
MDVDDAQLLKEGSKMTPRSILGWCLIAAIVGAGSVHAQEKTKRDFRPKKLMSPRKAIVDAKFLSANAVTDQVSDAELVIGVVVNGKARAYPINMLTGPAREIINDKLGGKFIAATW